MHVLQGLVIQWNSEVQLWSLNVLYVVVFVFNRFYNYIRLFSSIMALWWWAEWQWQVYSLEGTADGIRVTGGCRRYSTCDRPQGMCVDFSLHWLQIGFVQNFNSGTRLDECYQVIVYSCILSVNADIHIIYSRILTVGPLPPAPHDYMPHAKAFGNNIYITFAKPGGVTIVWCKKLCVCWPGMLSHSTSIWIILTVALYHIVVFFKVLKFRGWLIFSFSRFLFSRIVSAAHG